MLSKLTLNIYKISRYTHNHYARELKKLNLTMGQFPFVMEIANNDGISQEKLSELLMISKSTTATIVQQLLRVGLVSREVDPSDRRNYQLHATSEALKLIPQIEDIINECHQLITADLTDIERQIFADLTARVRQQTEISLDPERRS